MIRQEQLDAVLERLVLIGVAGLTVSEARGFGRSKGHDVVFRGSAYRIDFFPKALVEWYGLDEDAEAVVRAIQKAGATGRIGDGKIFVYPVEEAIRIRTGERGEHAIR
jgi:nitrogen regulatory protein P-II 1